MPSPHAWSLLCSDISSEDAALVLQGMKKWKTVKSQLMPCTTCSSGDPHSMRYKLLRCACKHCTDAVPYLQCAWRLKMLVCLESDTVDMHEVGNHHSRARTPSKCCITPRQRDFIKELARENLMPMRIRHALGRKFGLRPDALPSLRAVQNIVHHFRRTRLGGNDKRKAILEAVRTSAFSGREGDHDAFTFTNSYDGSGSPEVGNGSHANPFLVGMTTKALLRNAAREPGTFVMHLDATFKLNSVGYPVLVCGITDASRSFHLLALFITSQLQHEHFAAALVALRRMYARVNGAEMQVEFVLGDADKAQHKAFRDVFADCTFKYLMCFYHVVAKLHLTAFTAYVKAQWLTGNFANWQSFLTPPGYATTTNPVEQFNRALKRDYTHHRQLKMGLLLAQLLACCGHRSMALPRFSLAPTCPTTLQTRTRGLRRRGLLSENVLTKSSIEFLLGDADPELVHVHALPPMRMFVPELNRAREDMAISAQFGVHYARMEV
ncbi:hypothetical protein PF008_g5039 [Phytophthora fragariae]|uniref:MULE transposase domain-containing protein n=1 Tax=Phytophthora fragariae TaxID=53985 RepID=A0A6G0SBD7_9STRA|nr:hypothetical protein PF008_g5039 [Phytophthora fragariae]